MDYARENDLIRSDVPGEYYHDAGELHSDYLKPEAKRFPRRKSLRETVSVVPSNALQFGGVAGLGYAPGGVVDPTNLSVDVDVGWDTSGWGSEDLENDDFQHRFRRRLRKWKKREHDDRHDPRMIDLFSQQQPSDVPG